jgi:hypothetical protein
MPFVDALASVAPVLILFGLGTVLRIRGLLRPTTVDDLRRLVLTVALPSALFLTFLRVDVEARYLLIIGTVFAACIAVLAAGPLIGRLVGIESPLFAPLMTGFEAGMLGYGVYATVFGSGELYRFAVIDIGQVTFVFFVLTMILARRSAARPPTLLVTAVSFARTPVIVAIAGGMVAGSLGLGGVLDASPAGGTILATLGLLAAMTTPLIALVLGASIRFSHGGLGRPIRTVAVRMSLWIALAIVFNAVVIERLLGLDRLFSAAVFTMAVLPPPFVIPLFQSATSTNDRDRAYVTNTLSIGTVATMAAICVVALVYRA